MSYPNEQYAIAVASDDKDISNTVVESTDDVVWTDEDDKLNRSAIRKLDWTLVPLFGFIFMMASLGASSFMISGADEQTDRTLGTRT
jgi:hypothetical protein